MNLSGSLSLLVCTKDPLFMNSSLCRIMSCSDYAGFIGDPAEPGQDHLYFLQRPDERWIFEILQRHAVVGRKNKSINSVG